MDRKWLGARLFPACAVAALGACAGDIGDNGTTQNEEGATQDEAPYEGTRFPVQADLIDDIRCQISGNCEGTGGSGGSGGITGSSGIPQHGDPPALGLSDTGGPYWTDSYAGSTGQIYYPRDAPAPWAGMSLCGGFLNTGIEMLSWGSFYASWGIVTNVVWTGAFDFPDGRAWALSAGVEELKGENSSALSPLSGKMSGRYGTSGYSMGGGGTTISSVADPSLVSSIGMAPWAPTGLGNSVPSLFMCGDIDVIADCTTHSAWAYAEMSDLVPKMIAMVSGGHLSWFGPDAGWGAGGGLGLAFAKVFLEGDERWKPALISDSHVYDTNIY